MLQENQGQEGDLLEDQGALQTESIEDAEPSNNESDPESESTCNKEDLSATVSDDAVLGLIATAAPECQDQIDPLENAAQELKKESKTLQALLEKGNLFSDFMIFAHSGVAKSPNETLILCFSFLSLFCGISASSRSDMADLPGANAVCDDSQQQPTDKWVRFGARPNQARSCEKDSTRALPDLWIA